MNADAIALLGAFIVLNGIVAARLLFLNPRKKHYVLFVIIANVLVIAMMISGGVL